MAVSADSDSASCGHPHQLTGCQKLRMKPIKRQVAASPAVGWQCFAEQNPVQMADQRCTPAKLCAQTACRASDHGSLPNGQY